MSEHATARAGQGDALPPATAHQFDDAVQQHDASGLGMWVFLLTEILFFGGLFTIYTVYRSLYPAAFAHASTAARSPPAGPSAGPCAP